MNKAIFWDRDGVINEVILKQDKPYSPRRLEELVLKNGIYEILKMFKKKGFLNIIVTNQPDIVRGLMKQEVLDDIHNFIKKKLSYIDDILVCPHDDKDNCQCRKPKPGMLIDASKKFDVDLKLSFMIGDQNKDMQAGKNAGCKTVLISYEYNKNVFADFIVSDIKNIPDVILKGG